MKRIFFLLIIPFFVSCEKKSAEQIVNESLDVSGLEHLDGKEIEFLFRDREYGALHNGGKFEYIRLFKDSSNSIRDVLTNDGFVREINGEVANIPDSMAAKYTRSVNSVIYFALLPLKLNDPAVNLKYVGSSEIDGNKYDQVQVTFDQQGGGEDHEDIFYYWFNKETKKADYLAYKYYTDGGGVRFRKAYNERYVGNIRFVDYVNYKPADDVEFETIEKAYKEGKLEELSKIELQNIKVNSIDR